MELKPNTEIFKLFNENFEKIDRTNPENEKFAKLFDDMVLSDDEIKDFSYDDMKKLKQFQEDNEIFFGLAQVDSASKVSTLSYSPDENFNEALYNAMKNMGYLEASQFMYELEVNIADYYANRTLYPSFIMDSEHSMHELRTLNEEEKSQIDYNDFSRTLLDMFSKGYKNAQNDDFKDQYKLGLNAYSSIVSHMNNIENSVYS